MEEELASHSSILAWEMPWTEELEGYSPWGRKELDTPEHTHTLADYGAPTRQLWPTAAADTSVSQDAESVHSVVP